MIADLLHSLWLLLGDLFRSPRRLRAENLFLRHQLNIALRRASARPRLSRSDRVLLAWTTQFYPEVLGLAQVVKPETILRWHQGGLSSILALEIAEAGRTAKDRPRSA